MFKKGRVKKASVSIPMRKWKAGRVSHKEWDSTVSDLAVHKASEEEIQRRRLIHKSKNASAARRALGERAKRLFMDPATPGQVELEMKKLAILKEVLYDHDDMNEVLKRVDNTMSSVKTLFHGVPYRRSGNPNITHAPGSKNTTGSGPVQVRDEPTTQMSLLSDSVMDKHALNDENLSSGDEGEEEEKFESKVDYERFLDVLRESINKSIPSHGPSGDATAVTPVNNGKPESRQQALNCTEEVKRKMARTGNHNNNGQNEDSAKLTRKIDDTITKLTIGKRDGDKKKNQSVSFSLTNQSTVFPPPRANLTASNMTYENLQDAMESVNQNLNEMENRRGNKNQSETANISVKSDGLAGFTTTLIDAVTRLTVYMNEAEGRLLVSESRMEELKNQNDHQRALLDALTAELMGTQDQIQTVKDEASKQKEDALRKQAQFEKNVKEEVNSLRQIIKDLEKRNVEEINGAEDATHKQMKNLAVQMQDDFKVLETDATKQNDEGEEALKSDMLSLLSALKVENKKPSGERQSSQSTAQILAMNNATTKGAAQTVASVESQLRHLQLQHAEAQNRLQELTQVAGFLAEKVSESQCHSSSASDGSEPVTPSTCRSSTTPSIVSGLITPREPNEEFQAMIPTNASETDDSFSGITITSSLFANIGADTSRPSMQSSAFSQSLAPSYTDRRIVDDTSRPSVQSSAFSQSLAPSYTDRRIVEDYSSLKSSDRINISEDSFQELGGRNIPTLLQSNLYGISITSDAVKMLNPVSVSAQDRQQPALPSFKPTEMPSSLNADARNITTSIQQTQYNLEDRIAQLNQQHAEAQARLQNLIRRRSDIRSPSSLSSHSSGTGSLMKAIQISLPTDDMLKTPQIHKAPEPFKPMTLDEHSFD